MSTPTASDAEELPEDLKQAKAEAEAYFRLHNFSTEQVLQAGKEALLRLLVSKAMARTISHQEQAILRNLLRDNGMTMGMNPGADNPRPTGPATELPELSPPDYEE